MADHAKFSFADIAVQLALTANQEAAGAAEIEKLWAKTDNPVFKRSLEHVRTTCDLIAAAHYLLKALIPHEAAVRQLLAAAETIKSEEERKTA